MDRCRHHANHGDGCDACDCDQQLLLCAPWLVEDAPAVRWRMSFLRALVDQLSKDEQQFVSSLLLSVGRHDSRLMQVFSSSKTTTTCIKGSASTLSGVLLRRQRVCQAGAPACVDFESVHTQCLQWFTAASPAARHRFIVSLLTRLDLDTIDLVEALLRDAKHEDVLTRLPRHLVKRVLRLLSREDLLEVACVSRAWNSIARECVDEKRATLTRAGGACMMGSTRERDLLGEALDTSCSAMQSTVRGRHSVTVEGGAFPFPSLERRHSLKALTLYDSMLPEGWFIERDLFMHRFRVRSFNAVNNNLAHTSTFDFTARSPFAGEEIPENTVTPLGVELGRVLAYNGGDFVVAGSHRRAVDVYRVDTGTRVKTMLGHAGSVRCLYVNETLDVVLSGSFDGSVRLWSLCDGHRRHARLLAGHRSTVYSLAAAGTAIVSGSRDGTVRVWDRLSGAPLCVFGTHEVPVCSATLAHTDSTPRVVAGTSAGDIFTFDVSQRRCVSRIKKAHSSLVSSLQCAGGLLVSSGVDGVVNVFHAAHSDQPLIRRFQHPCAVSVARVQFQRCVTSGSDGRVRLWSLASGKCLRVLCLSRTSAPINSLAFVDRRRLVVATDTAITDVTFFDDNGRVLDPDWPIVEEPGSQAEKGQLKEKSAAAARGATTTKHFSLLKANVGLERLALMKGSLSSSSWEWSTWTPTQKTPVRTRPHSSQHPPPRRDDKLVKQRLECLAVTAQEARVRSSKHQQWRQPRMLASSSLAADGPTLPALAVSPSQPRAVRSLSHALTKTPFL